VSYGPPPQAVANVPANRFGVNVELDKIVRDEDLQRSVQLIRAAGFGFVRQVFAWNEIEISAKGDFFDHKNGKSAWDKYDHLVDAANAAGLQFIARLERPPDWARPAGSLETAPPRSFDDYGDFVAAFTQHFKGRITYVQIWNEPNRFEDWGEQPVDPAAYTQLLRIGYARAKEIDPSMVVLSAALTPTTDCCTKNRPDPLYLQQMYDAGARGSFDVLGAQAYGLRAGPEDPWQDLPLHPNEARKAVIDSHNTNFGRVVLDRQVMVRNGDAAKPVWVSEFGWNALPLGWTGDASPWGSVSLAQQAGYTVAAYQRAQREWPWLGVMNLWLFQDLAPAPNDPTQFFGLVDEQFQPRPVYDAVRALTQQPASAATGSWSADAAAVQYSGAWQASPRVSPVSGASATVRFEGSAVSLELARGPAAGIAYLAVDGSPTFATDVPKDSAGRAAVDLYAATAGRQLIPVASGLPSGMHELTATVSGLANPASSGPAVEIDGFSVGLSRDQRPYYAGGLLTVAGALVLGWRGLRALAARDSRILPLARFLGRGDALLLAVPLSIPFYLQPLRVRGVEVPASEALIGLALAAYVLRTALAGEWRWPRTAFGWPALLFFAAATLSVGAAEFPRYALREWRTDVLEPLILFVLILLVRPRVKVMLNSLLAGALIVLASGFVQYAAHRGIQAEGVLRMVGIYRSPDNFALYLGRMVPIAAALALLAPLRPPWRVVYGAGAALATAGVLLSFTRGAWLGVLAALLVVGGFAGRRWLAGGVVAAAGLAVALSSLQARRIQSLFQFTPGSTGYTRLALWHSAARMIADHPWFGVGLDNFLYQYPRYIQPDARSEPDLSHPHDLVLDLWSRIGIFGLAAFVWIQVRFFRTTASVIRKTSGWERAAAVGLLASMIDCLVHGLVDNSYFLIDLSLTFWLTVALVQLLEWGSPHREERAT
jgi:O-antigen ligase